MRRTDVVRYAVLAVIFLLEAAVQLHRHVDLSRVVVTFAIVSQLLPVLAVEQLPRPIPPARFWIWAWSLTFFLSDLAATLVRYLMGRNLWLEMFTHPIEDAALLMALSWWQLTPVMRLAYRIGIPLLIVTNTLLASGFGELNDFRDVSGPARLLVLSAAVVYTLVVRMAAEEGEVTRRDWFWACLGAAVFYTSFVIVDPISSALYPEHLGLAILVYTVKAAVDVVAFILIWKGMRCPLEVSSRSTLPPSLPSS